MSNSFATAKLVFASMPSPESFTRSDMAAISMTGDNSFYFTRASAKSETRKAKKSPHLMPLVPDPFSDITQKWP